MPTTPWPQEVKNIIEGDLVAAFAYCTPALGTIVIPVCPLGVVDPGEGLITISSPLVLSRKLARLRSNPRVALAFYTRHTGMAPSPGSFSFRARLFPRRACRPNTTRACSRRSTSTSMLTPATSLAAG